MSANQTTFHPMSQFIKVNHRALAHHTEQQAIKGPKKYWCKTIQKGK